MENKKRIVWLSILQGWSMLLVVVGHIDLTNGVYGDAHLINGIDKEIYLILRSFRMPMFMLISGFLFYITHIKKEKSYQETVISKLKRLGVPFLFFTLATLILKFAFNPIMKRPVELSFRQAVDSFLYPATNPLGELWFVATLFILFLFYPVYKISLQKASYTFFLMGCAVLLHLFFPAGIELLCLSRVASYFVFFYAGICLSKFEWGRKFDSWYVLIACICIYAGLWVIKAPYIILAITGIIGSFSLCMRLSHSFPGFFSSFRNYTYQIFLIGIFPQMLVRFAFVRIEEYGTLQYNVMYIFLYVMSILLALYIPVVVAKVVEKIPWKWVRMSFGLS
jgi:fucose 4-O-acetylase-like acetyltransferase